MARCRSSAWESNLRAGLRRGVVVNVEEAARAIAASVDKAQRTAGYEIASAVVSLAGAQVSSINSRGVVGVSGRADFGRGRGPGE